MIATGDPDPPEKLRLAHIACSSRSASRYRGAPKPLRGRVLGDAGVDSRGFEWNPPVWVCLITHFRTYSCEISNQLQRHQIPGPPKD